MRDYEYLPAAQRRLVEQLDEEDRKRGERERELEAGDKFKIKHYENIQYRVEMSKYDEIRDEIIYFSLKVNHPQRGFYKIIPVSDIKEIIYD